MELRLNRQSGMCARCTEPMRLNEVIAFKEILQAGWEAAADADEVAGIRRERGKMRQRNSQLCRKHGLKGWRGRSD